ncbi:hypothetical protein VTN49DRAFT_8073 [Thermomyces lanuginosus]|uniref:uncharacterized protein n=1 Tax=Thermomyces lanuginosus TaxID=5541 RepID=UPI003743B96D
MVLGALASPLCSFCHVLFRPSFPSSGSISTTFPAAPSGNSGISTVSCDQNPPPRRSPCRGQPWESRLRSKGYPQNIDNLRNVWKTDDGRYKVPIETRLSKVYERSI